MNHSPLQPLKGSQSLASRPDDHVWLSASAGTGKTHVLTARVFRLLLRKDVSPENILCLTFTKAGAAEMAERIHNRLAAWVQMDDGSLFNDLEALGEASGPAARDHARTLFASVLDASGGGLRIQTIHSFCQTLLSAFPLEAGLIPGFRPLDEREQKSLARSALADLLVSAETEGNAGLIADMQALSLRLGEEGAENFLARCARAPDAMTSLPHDIQNWLRDRLDLPVGDVETAIASECADELFDIAGLRRISAANKAWATKTALEHCDIIARWCGASGKERAATLAELLSLFWTGKGEPRKYSPKLIDAEPEYEALAARMAECCDRLLKLRARVAWADLYARALSAGRAYAHAYSEAKRLAGAVDFDDLIRTTVRLLNENKMADWIRFKLDQATDHILVDEAQDTNIAQWQIVAALASDFFSGEGAKGEKVRTIFTVGDFKQAIFGFQGTSPDAFRAAELFFSRQCEEAEQNFHKLSLVQSFRSTPPVLDLVDAVVEELGSEWLGLDESAEAHQSAVPHPGEVILWNPVSADLMADQENEDEGEEEWLSNSSREHAARIASQISEWLSHGLMLESKGRTLQAGDVMILVRKRSDLARLIVARLYEEGVPVAGIDRLRLNAPLAVRDLLAALRFALQPEDDLNLANLLVSPLIGWTQEQLFERARREKGVRLWSHLRRTMGGSDNLEPLYGLLGQADFTTPYRYLENILSGPMDGRRKLLGRLGAEARDPIDELLNASLSFEAEAHPSLQTFVDWFDRGDVEIVRDASASDDAVRVLTVHGAKGLQAPMVILADATVDPKAMGNMRGFDWLIEDSQVKIPVLSPRRTEKMGLIEEAAKKAERAELEEHWRLLYVALTRAEEKLVVGGALGPKAKGLPPELSWYALVARAMERLGVIADESPRWGHERVYQGVQSFAPRKVQAVQDLAPETDLPLPVWLGQPAPAEARPPRPLAPSAQEEDSIPDPPPSALMRAAAERGKWLHSLYERLPAVVASERRAAADSWLLRVQGVKEEGIRSEIIDRALAIIENPDFAALFSPDALAEAPIAAVVGGEVVAGTVDRLSVTEECVRVVDFKTGRFVPVGAADVPRPHLRQMAAYAAALEVIFPGRRIEAALLYTSGPKIIVLPGDLLVAHKPGYAGAQQEL
ncbi:double-strand break repair helicase AddA [Rhizorhapis suberifaciens]|uniref:DNA 3'-5' helicase n=1 Tax=Rhizorhapis suberifaciens TaxID=13656 RepID=A0A840HUE4_9SPHN|nr:double-strand break repair helicase AddA [Rhizorhapis suberifaciens]MBB4641635.1 ATP-dependent helicase/nuclease subunit A [Rhizorhapis suberifaciens]